LRSIADLNVVANRSDDTPKRSDSVNVVRYGVSTQTTILK
jgi:pilus assembly protein CpaB